MWPASLFQLGRIVLDPAIDRGMIHVQTPFEHHLFEIAIAQCVAQIPSHAQKNEIGLEVTPFERVRLDHGEFSFSFFLECNRSVSFLQHNPINSLMGHRKIF